MRTPDNNTPDHDDPDKTQVIAIPVDAFAEGHVSDEVNAFDDADDVDQDGSEEDFTDGDESVDEEPVSPLRRRWRQVAAYATAGDVRRHLPYAAAAAVAIIAVITVLIVTGTEPKKSDEVSDAASLSDAEVGTQSFDDITQLLQGGLANTTPVETGVATTVSETPTDVPPPGEVPNVEPGDIDQSITPATVTVTDSAQVDTVSGDDPVTTETSVVTETAAPSTITETPSGGPGPGFSIDGSISVQASRQPSTQAPGGPSTVTVVVPADTTPPQPSTVTVIVPATTTAQQPKPSTAKPTGCPTTTTSKPKTTTSAPATTTRPPATTRPQRTTTPAPTSKKPTTTTTARPCK
ncbi:hypothetical protein [Nocardia sp. NPDC052316]|uniref:hypothetical protein n=1 Tax=Nocardia sp. NPDC052316 TaxID=3364329 RepID=UPI0037C88931